MRDAVMTRRARAWITICGAGLLLGVLSSGRTQAQYVATQNPYAATPNPYAAIQNPSEITVIDATTVFANSMMMQDGQIPHNVLAGAQGIVIVPGMLRRGVCCRIAAWPRRLVDPRRERRLAGAAVYRNRRRQLRLSNRRTGDRPRVSFPHAAECERCVARHAQGRRRCIRRGGSDRPTSRGRNRSEFERRNSFLFACPRRLRWRLDRRLLDHARSIGGSNLLPTARLISSFGNAIVAGRHFLLRRYACCCTCASRSCRRRHWRLGRGRKPDRRCRRDSSTTGSSLEPTSGKSRRQLEALPGFAARGLHAQPSPESTRYPNGVAEVR